MNVSNSRIAVKIKRNCESGKLSHRAVCLEPQSLQTSPFQASRSAGGLSLGTLDVAGDDGDDGDDGGSSGEAGTKGVRVEAGSDPAATRHI